MSSDLVMAGVAIGGLVVFALSVVFIGLLIINLSGRSKVPIDIVGWAGAFLMAGLATFLSLGLDGWSYKASAAESLQLPLIQRLADPEAYKRDLFVDTASELPSGAARLTARKVAKGKTLERAAWDHHIAARYLLLFAFFFLAHYLFQDIIGACLSLALFVVSWPLRGGLPLSGEALESAHFDLNQAAWPYALFALAFWGIGSTALASAISGVIVWLQPSVGVLLLATLGAAACAEAAVDRRQPLLLHLVPALAPGAIIALPLLLLHLSPHLFLDGAALASLLKTWALGAGALDLTARAAGAAGILVLSGYTLWRSRSYEEYRFRFPSLLLALPALWLLDYLLGTVVALRPAVLAGFLRADAVLVVLALAAAGHQIHKYSLSPRAQTWCVGGLILLAWAGRPDAGYLIGVAVVWALWEWANEREFEGYGPWLKGGSFAAAAALAAWSAASLAMPGAGWALEHDRSAGTLVALTLAALGSWNAALLPLWVRRTGTLALVAIVFLPALRVTAARTAAKAWQVETEDAKEIRELSARLSELLSPQDLLLTPPTEPFRLALERPVVFEWDDAAAARWAPGYDALWLERLKDLRIDPAKPQPEQAFRSLAPRELAAIAEKRGATHLIAYADQPVSARWFTKVEESRRFKVYQYLFNYR